MGDNGRRGTDGDGDIDMVLGSLIRMPTNVPDFLTVMGGKSPSVLYLINQQRSPTNFVRAHRVQKSDLKPGAG